MGKPRIVGLGSTALADSISYLCSAVMIALVRVALSPEAEQGEAPGRTVGATWFAYWRDWLEGLSAVGREKGIRALFLAVGLGSLADGVINALFVLFPAAILGVGSAQYGAMLTALGIGSLLGSVCVGWLAKTLAPARLFWLGWMGKGLTYLLAFNVRSFPLILALFTLSGVPTVGSQVSIQTLLQTSVQDRLRARVYRRICCYPLTPSPGGHRPGQYSRRSARYPAPSRSRVCSLSSCGFGCFLTLHASSCAKALSVANQGNRRAG
jgi:hypothetical protein